MAASRAKCIFNRVDAVIYVMDIFAFGDTADDGRRRLAADIIPAHCRLAQQVCYLTGVVSGLSLWSRTKTASSFAGSTLLALRLIEWVAPGGSDQPSPA